MAILILKVSSHAIPVYYSYGKEPTQTIMFSRNRKKEAAEKKKLLSQKVGSIAFYVAIPCSFILATTFCYSLVKVVMNVTLSRETLTLFGCSFLGAVIVFGTSKIPRLRTFLHESKHAVLVILTGNKLKEFKAAKDTGHVSYDLYTDRIHLGPFITLAPYFFPLFSLPLFFIAIIAGNWYSELFIVLLSFSLGLDLTTALQELHPHQSDLQRIFGGKWIAYLFIGGANLAWSLICLLWILGGWQGLLLAGSTLLNLGQTIAQLFRAP